MMNTISNMVEKRNKAWQGAKAFLESKRDKDGLISVSYTHLTLPTTPYV